MEKSEQMKELFQNHEVSVEKTEERDGSNGLGNDFR
jgi:hypothetical protein